MRALLIAASTLLAAALRAQPAALVTGAQDGPLLRTGTEPALRLMRALLIAASTLLAAALRGQPVGLVPALRLMRALLITAFSLLPAALRGQRVGLVTGADDGPLLRTGRKPALRLMRALLITAFTLLPAVLRGQRVGLVSGADDGPLLRTGRKPALRLMHALLIAALILLPAALRGQPVGLVTGAEDGRLLRASTELALRLKTGDILFPGDAISSGKAPVSLLYCPEQSIVTLAPASEAVAEAGPLRIKTGRVSGRKAAASCWLPPVERSTAAGQQHYGATLVRAARTSPAEPLKLPEDLPPATADPLSRLERAAALERRSLKAEAAEEYRRLAVEWPDAVWIRSRLFVLEEEPPPAPAAPGEPGKTYALLIGISQYQAETIRPLQFAHQDAVIFDQYLKSPRGGRLADSDVVLLTNQKATTAAIRNAFQTFLKARAGKNDTVILFLAAHGVAEPGRGAYIVTYDSDPQDLASTALPMDDVQKLLRDDLSRVGRVLAYVDACRSGTIGTIVNRTAGFNSSIERLGEAEGELFLFTASRAREVSYEGPQYGGGHGAFTYFLLSAFNGEADRNSDGNVSLNEVIDYVRTKVAEGTYDRQHPRDYGTMETNQRVADTQQEGIRLLKWTGPPPEKQVQMLAQAGPGITRGLDLPAPAATGFDRAMADGRLSPDDPSGAFVLLRALRPRLTPQQYLTQENRLRVALEERGQQVLLRYLTGDQAPQTRADFAAGAGWFDAARLLTPESLLLESRAAFCRGRTRLFDKDYPGAADLLERAARLDSGGAYSYNALGIAYLEQADYARAVPAFRDAVRRAPYWAYPLHNLALAYTEVGDYESAVRSYRQAIRLAPQYSYLPYNLGLVYQRVNRRKEAEAAYRQAIALGPNLGEPYNALGYLKASSRRAAEAERLYRQAVQKNPDLLAARHNLAVLLAGKPDRAPEAAILWRENLAKSPEYLPSRLSLARALARQGKSAEASQEYLEIVNRKPDYVAARMALADLEAKAGRPEAALAQLTEARKLQPENSLIWEQIGDLEASRARATEARAAFEQALRHAPDKAARKRLEKKLR